MNEAGNRGKPCGLLLVGFDYSSANAEEFHDWYDTEHIPERKRVQGFLSAQRWLAMNNPKVSIATYDLESIAVLRSPAYKAIAGDNLSPWSKRMIRSCRGLCRFEAEQVLPGRQATAADAEAMLLVVARADADPRALFDREGVPRPLDIPGMLGTRSFKTNDTTRIAIYEVRTLNRAVMEMCQAWMDSALLKSSSAPFSETPWTFLCKRYARAETS